MTPVDRHALLNSGSSRDEIHQAEHAWFALFSLTTDQNSRHVMTESDSITDWFHPQTPGREIDLFSDLVHAGMPDDGSPITPRAKLTNVSFRMSASVDDPAVVRYTGLASIF